MAYRTICEILEEARKCNETRNYSYLLGILEEIQNAGNRMEAALWQQKDIKRLREELKELKEEKKALKAEIQALEKKKEKLTGQKAEKKNSRSIRYDFLDD